MTIDTRFAFITVNGKDYQVLKYEDVLDEEGNPTGKQIAVDWDEAKTAELIAKDGE